ncbi:MAG: adenylate cyclase-like protein, partial [uncultured bacterium]
MKWDSEYRLAPDSDELMPRWAYQRLLDSLKLRLTRDGDQESDRSYVDNIPMLARYFLDVNQLSRLIKTAAEVCEFSDATGRRLALYWENDKINGFWHNLESGVGFLAVIDLEKLAKFFAFDLLRLRKGYEWKATGIEPGWLIEPKPGFYLLPYPFSPLEHDYWSKWLNSKPNGVHEHRGIIVSVRRVAGGVTLIAAKSGETIEKQYQRSVFLLLLLMFFSLALPMLIVSAFRRNQGMALGIRWQIIALFVLVMALPSAVIFHLGSELLKERRLTYENDAYKVLERIKKNLEENTDYAFRHLENLASEMGNRLMALSFDEKGHLVDHSRAKSIVKEYYEKTGLSAVYLLDASAEMIFTGKGSSVGKDMIPLVQALAKIKLRYTGNLKQKGKASEVGMVDLFIEASGGVSVDAIQGILKYRENRAFEFKFSDRRVCFFIGEFSPANSKETYIVAVLLKDSDFERMFLRLMIENHFTEKKYQNRVQLFFGPNSVNEDTDYFSPVQIPEPWFDYSMAGNDTAKLGRLSEPTRFAGASVRETVELENKRRKCLYFSFRPSNLDMHTVLALFDYSEISEALAQLRVFIMITFLVSLLIGYILAKIMARSLIEPVALLRSGVEQIEKGNYNTQLIMPGEDELVELAESFNVMSRGLDERARMTRYLSKSAVEAVVSGEDGYMGGKKVPATILFSDIRSFTTISESNSPEVVVNLLNDYFAVMNQVVEEHGG